MRSMPRRMFSSVLAPNPLSPSSASVLDRRLASSLDRGDPAAPGTAPSPSSGRGPGSRSSRGRPAGSARAAPRAPRTSPCRRNSDDLLADRLARRSGSCRTPSGRAWRRRRGSRRPRGRPSRRRAACTDRRSGSRAGRRTRGAAPRRRRSDAPSEPSGPAQARPRSHSSSAFCVCSRFSAWSHTTECGPVDHLVGDLLAAVRRQAVHHDRRPARRSTSFCVELVGREHQRALVGLGLLPHARPHVGVQDVGAASTASIGSCSDRRRSRRSRRRSPRRAARPAGSARTRAGSPTRTCIPAFAPPSSSECATLLPSPR